MSRITVSMYLCRQIQTSFLPPYHAQANCIQANANKIVELIMSLNCQPSCSLQFSYAVWAPVRTIRFVDTKGHSPTYESGFDRTS